MCSPESEGFSGYASDLWAAGVCLYIFTTGLVPFFSLVPTDLFALIAEPHVRYEGLGMSDALQDLLGRMLRRDPATRPGVGECLTHAFCARARAERAPQEAERAVAVAPPRNLDVLRNGLTRNSAPGASDTGAAATKTSSFKFKRKPIKKIWKTLKNLRSSRGAKKQADAMREIL